jgi:hypothetical protein
MNGCAPSGRKLTKRAGAEGKMQGKSPWTNGDLLAAEIRVEGEAADPALGDHRLLILPRSDPRRHRRQGRRRPGDRPGTATAPGVRRAAGPAAAGLGGVQLQVSFRHATRPQDRPLARGPAGWAIGRPGRREGQGGAERRPGGAARARASARPGLGPSGPGPGRRRGRPGYNQLVITGGRSAPPRSRARDVTKCERRPARIASPNRRTQLNLRSHGGWSEGVAGCDYL